MLDYKLLTALAAVVEQAGFERAALSLGLSQSAVSQRIKLLEARVGQPVLLRAVPPSPTEVGRQLLNHVQQVRLLERELQAQVPCLDTADGVQRLRIALNADSLATWWAAAVSDFCRRHGVLLDLVVDDQEVSLKRMRAGEVAACVCASERPVAGGRSLALGAMRYLAVASPAFMARHFAEGFEATRLGQVPALVYGPDDSLQHRYMLRLGASGAFPHHFCPSSEGFMRMAEAGLGWGLVPQLQAREQLAEGALVELLPDNPLDVPLYWHYWRSGGQLLEQLTEALFEACRHGLVQPGRHL
jgi:LysR family transcriptional regulator (chromosome initiation inhibitor)